MKMKLIKIKASLIKKIKSFTLVEAILIVLIIGIISSFILVSLNNIVNLANDARAKNYLSSLQKIIISSKKGGNFPIETVECEIGNNCTNLQSFLVPEYFPTLSQIPRDSSGQYFKYQSTDGNDFTIRTVLSNGNTYQYNYFLGFSMTPPSSCVSNGGIICTEIIDGVYTVNKYTGVGSTTWTAPNGVSTIEYLIVAGGGGAISGSGGGGAGGLLTTPNYSVSGTYTITVGDGGAGGLNYTASNGENSSFGSIVATGGGYGELHANLVGSSGGSGGGGKTGGSGIAGQGHNGGNATGSYGVAAAAGGGGAGFAGVNNTAGNFGSGTAGGNGIQSTITGTSIYYAGGGGGASRSLDAPPYYSGGAGGLGGGGKGGDTPLQAGTDGVDGLGGGGGGGASSGTFGMANGGSGGSGVVIIRYLTPIQ
jgi:type II secretory pathway pseudopilin PulG